MSAAETPGEYLTQAAKVFHESPTRRLLAEGALDALPEWLKTTGAHRVLFVLGVRSFRNSEAFRILKSRLINVELLESPPVPENPSIAFVEELCRKYRAQGIQAVVGAGGGSAIDAAKIAAVLLMSPHGQLTRRGAAGETPFEARLPLAAIPTTSGTGSEVTPYVSLQTEEHKKITITDPLLFPDIAIIDPLLTLGLPAGVTASTGFDALAQSIESFWSVRHSPISDQHALRGAALALRHLRIAVREPSNRAARLAMSTASTEAGLAIAHTATTAVHAVSYPITTFFGVPHGHACALTLAEFVRYNESFMREDRYGKLWEALGAGSAFEAAAVIEKLMADTGLERSLSRLGIDAMGVEKILQNGFRPDRVRNNPRELTKEALKTILQRIF